ncbi:unnamed protein product [Polarella glacialis]|uniref:Uncharacterized protein n=1 Tax=Polarella glacialis TaxID=89957 RepID=A0A813KE94_POLGL|nr:unnamed protein product [Polarella glacialis]
MGGGKGKGKMPNHLAPERALGGVSGGGFKRDGVVHFSKGGTSSSKGKGKGKGKGSKGGKGGKGKGKGKDKGKKGKQLKKDKKKARQEEDDDGEGSESEEPEDEVEEDDVFWKPTWGTLGPMEVVTEAASLNKLGRKREIATDFGFSIGLKKPVVMRLKQAAEDPEEKGPSKKNVAQRRRRQRQLAVLMDAARDPAPLALTSAPHVSSAAAPAAPVATGAAGSTVVKPVKKKATKRTTKRKGIKSES